MAGCAVGCRDEATSVPVSSGIAEAGLLRRIHFLAETADFLAELSSHAKELLQRDAVERATGQFVFDIFLRPEQAGQFLFTGGGQFFLGGFLQHGPERFNFGGLLAVPFDEGALGDAEFAGGVVEAPALCSEFDEFVYFFRCVHTFMEYFCFLSSMSVRVCRCAGCASSTSGPKALVSVVRSAKDRDPGATACSRPYPCPSFFCGSMNCWPCASSTPEPKARVSVAGSAQLRSRYCESIGVL